MYLFQAVVRWIDHQCAEKGLELKTENRRSVIGDAACIRLKIYWNETRRIPRIIRKTCFKIGFANHR